MSFVHRNDQLDNSMIGIYDIIVLLIATNLKHVYCKSNLDQ